MEVIGLPLRGKLSSLREHADTPSVAAVAVEDRRMSSLHDFFPLAHKLRTSHKLVGAIHEWPAIRDTFQIRAQTINFAQTRRAVPWCRRHPRPTSRPCHPERNEVKSKFARRVIDERANRKAKPLRDLSESVALQWRKVTFLQEKV